MPEQTVPSPGRYRHFKGGEYTVFGVATHSESGEAFVVYCPEYGERRLTVRPLAMWTEHVERDGYAGPRFVKIAEELEQAPDG